ncbi:far upstream element-binding protein 2-like isoform X2 [Quillaja saponaria]|uniref:Far upstream element-binding protein 2-like isoform X2 n=1 Tax=Quillaja saponaria TaxID=32244 RepID=A0AAD7L1S2_QUISA|nr:far upstream element-binding protein 2-like isoform X2 [Quillaja saponaria]
MAPRSGFGFGWEQRPPPNMQGHTQMVVMTIMGHKAVVYQMHHHLLNIIVLVLDMLLVHPYHKLIITMNSHMVQTMDIRHLIPKQHISRVMVMNTKNLTYGMPSQGQPTQSYGPPRGSQPGDVPYQGATPAQSYGPSIPSQQPYPYASSGLSQPTYPPRSAPPVDGYNQPPAASGPIYQHQDVHLSYGQPAHIRHLIMGKYLLGVMPQYTQSYLEQPVLNNASYGY